MSENPIRIVVVGSLNVDHTLNVVRIPSPGETVSANGALTCFGGKGANQAVAAVRAAGEAGSISLIGCVGSDVSGVAYRGYLEEQGIDVSGVLSDGETPTGAAFIVVDAAGENTIVVNPGANHAIDTRAVDERRELIQSADTLLIQLECPLAVVRRAAEIARGAGVKVVINPSPWSDEFLTADVPCDILIVNENEAAELGGETEVLKSEFAKMSGLETLVVTRGSRMTRVFSRDGECFEILPPKVSPVDTVGAGDSFAGAFTAGLAEGRSLRNAVGFANVAGALATLKMGAQSAIPWREAIESHLSADRVGVE